MTEPSYYALSSMKPPPKDTSGAEDLPNSRSTVSLAALRPRSPKNTTSSAPLWHTLAPLEVALFPLAAIAYLAFCYTVHGKVVPVTTYGLYAVTPEHLVTIKGGITAITILVITIALVPIGRIISSLKSEEFFRILATRSQGVPLETVNSISNPTFGNVDMLMAVWKKTCSNHYILGGVASLLIMILTTLAPGALTIESVLSDGELMAFPIGAVSVQSVLNGTYPEEPAYNASLKSDTAASITWAEMELGVQYSFGVAGTSEPDYQAYIVPLPLSLDTTTSARWLTDVIGVNPTCSWATTNLTTTVQVPVNSTAAIGQYLATAYLPDVNLDVQINAQDMPDVGDSSFATVKNPTSSVTNHTTQAPASDGSTVFLLGQCKSGCSPGISGNITLDLTGIDTTFEIALSDQTWSMAILTCKPNITIETREVRSDRQGILTVQPRPAGRVLTRQGNLNPIQTTAMFSIATMSLTQSAGPLSGNRVQYSPLGSEVQGDVLYGKSQFDDLPGSEVTSGTVVIITPAQVEDITQRYTLLIQSAAKSYLAGYLGTAYVPGRISTTEIVFAASIPNLAISTVVFALLAGVIVLAHFRPGQGAEFTLINVAAAVHESELPARFAQAKAGGQLAGNTDETDLESETRDKVHRTGANSVLNDQEVVEMLGETHIFMQRREDGSPVLHIE